MSLNGWQVKVSTVMSIGTIILLLIAYYSDATTATDRKSCDDLTYSLQA